MSGQGNTVTSSVEQTGTRRCVSMVDKLEEARARRAAVLSASRNAANAPGRAKPRPVMLSATLAKPKPKIVPETESATVDVPSEPVLAPVDTEATAIPEPEAAARDRRRGTAWLTRGLFALLAVLVGLAVVEYRNTLPATPPVLTAKAPGPLAVQTYGAPLLVAMPDRLSGVAVTPRPSRPDRIAIDQAPVRPLDPAPLILDRIPTPVAPPARPNGLTLIRAATD